jgi:hypothetical protein
MNVISKFYVIAEKLSILTTKDNVDHIININDEVEIMECENRIDFNSIEAGRIYMEDQEIIGTVLMGDYKPLKTEYLINDEVVKTVYVTNNF